MRRRVHKRAPVPSTVETPEPIDLTGSEISITICRLRGAAALVTLDDPTANPEAARGAFARLRPPEGVLPAAVSDWRDSVARVAQAVRVVAAPKAAHVALASTRGDAEIAVGNVREEAMRLADETKDADVVALVRRLLDEAGV